jgi:hypothetical protein
MALMDEVRTKKVLKGKALIRELKRIANDDTAKYDFVIDASEIEDLPPLKLSTDMDDEEKLLTTTKKKHAEPESKFNHASGLINL